MAWVVMMLRPWRLDGAKLGRLILEKNKSEPAFFISGAIFSFPVLESQFIIHSCIVGLDTRPKPASCETQQSRLRQRKLHRQRKRGDVTFLTNILGALHMQTSLMTLQVAKYYVSAAFYRIIRNVSLLA